MPLARLRGSHERVAEGEEGEGEPAEVPQASAGTGLPSELFIARVLRVERVPLVEEDGQDAELYKLPLLYHRRRYTTVQSS